ncbi:MAG: cytochrome-c peroxidase [Gemmatimonadales bacterium]
MRIRHATGLLLGLAVWAATSCRDAAVPEEDLVARFGLEPLPPMVFPADNPPDSARIALGLLLFFDPILSGDEDVACATCHLPALAMADGRDLPAGPTGVGLGPDRVLTDPDMVPEARNSISIINAGFNRFVAQQTADGLLFWDGRRRRLENLVTLPLREFTELRHDAYAVEDALDSVLARLRSIAEYDSLFRAAFPGMPDPVIDSIAFSQALAQFVRSLVSDDSPYDRFVAGDWGALTDAQRRGLVLFYGEARCAACHLSPMLSDFDFHVVGARQLGPGFQTTPHEDFGRWNVTGLETDRWKFRTPSLRNVAETAPYMHSGGYATLGEVVEFFNRGGGDLAAVPRARLEVRPLKLSARELDDLVAFLEALTDVPDVQTPDRLPSGLEPPRR